MAPNWEQAEGSGCASTMLLAPDMELAVWPSSDGTWHCGAFDAAFADGMASEQAAKQRAVVLARELLNAAANNLTLYDAEVNNA